MNLVNRAQAFAIERHGDQKRKYTGEPYTKHLENVAMLVQSVPHSEEMVAAAWLHDVLEDTKTKHQEVLELFGARVYVYVNLLSDLLTPAHGNRAFRKERCRKILCSAPGDVQTIKLADLIDNADTIIQHDSNFASVYMREMRELVDGMVRGAPELRLRAQTIIGEYTISCEYYAAH